MKPIVGALGLLVVAVAFAAGCKLDVDPPEGRLACTTAADCPSRWVCGADNRCRRADRPGMDAGPGTDAGDVDAAGIDAAEGTDAGDGVDAGSDDAGPCPMPCGLFPTNCGCPMGQSCYFGTVRLCDNDGAAADGEICTFPGECESGLICRPTGMGNGTCNRPCATDDQCVGPGARCILNFAAAGVMICTNSCEPGDQTGCGPGLRCTIGAAADMSLATDCAPPSGGAIQGEPCTVIADCEVGFTCIPAMGCLKYCRVGGPATDCGPGLMCNGFMTPLLVQGQEYGACN